MKEKLLYIIWAFLYILCVGLGTFEGAEGPLKVAMILIAVVFFVPGALLLWDALAAGNRKGVLRIRWISIASLALTLITMLAFILAGASQGNAPQLLYDVLILVSSPMVCGQYWLISLFLWSCLLSATFAIPNRR